MHKVYKGGTVLDMWIVEVTGVCKFPLPIVKCSAYCVSMTIEFSLLFSSPLNFRYNAVPATKLGIISRCETLFRIYDSEDFRHSFKLSLMHMTTLFVCLAWMLRGLISFLSFFFSFSKIVV